MFVVTKILLKWRGQGLLLEFTLSDCVFSSDAVALWGLVYMDYRSVAGSLLGSIPAAGASRVCSSGAVPGIDLGHLEKGLLKAGAFPEKE